MAFDGKASYDPGAPPGEDIAEDVSAIVSLIARSETPLLDILTPAENPAWSTYHEWLDDALLPNRTLLTASAASGATSIAVTTGEGKYFRAGDLLKGSKVSTSASASYAGDEVLLVTARSTDTLTVTRAYGGTTARAYAVADEMQRVGRAALEGEDSPTAFYDKMNRRKNYTQIFTEPVNISGTLQAARILGGIGSGGTFNREVAKRIKELLAQLEAAVVQSVAPASTQQGSATVRRSMDGLIAQITTNAIDGSGYTTGITEAGLNLAFRTAWDYGADHINLVLVNGYQKRAINSFIGASNRWWKPEDMKYKDVVAIYESDYGPAQVLLSRWVPRDMVIGLDSDRMKVLPLGPRSFYLKLLGATGDAEKAQVIGEYTSELRNGPDGAHFVISDIPFTL